MELYSCNACGIIFIGKEHLRKHFIKTHGKLTGNTFNSDKFCKAEWFTIINVKEED